MKHLKFNDVLLCPEAAGNNQEEISYQPSPCLESFCMDNTVDYFTILSVQFPITSLLRNTVKSWMKYIGVKYPQLLDMDLNFESCITHDETCSTTASLMNAVNNMKHLRKYAVDISYDKQPILVSMTANDIQLRRFGFSIDKQDSVEETLNCIQTAQSVSTVSSLSLTCHTGITASSVQQSLIHLCLGLNHLNELKVISSQTLTTPMLLVEILKNLTMLKSLDFGYLVIDGNLGDNDLFYNTFSSSNI